ncbi:MAG TPA: diiron oxygenase [Thermoanaerobaculia bacterium]|jgi:hypothetical protein|nr:diiron oxygenase [Thermoanaerobaculia bacterium]
MPEAILPDAVDPARFFIPAELTPLFHTPVYGELAEAQRLRYNQLHALYFNEQIQFFETALGRPILSALLRESWPERLTDGLRQFHDEELRHTEMFRRLNRLAAPDLYAGGDLRFVQVPAFWTAVMGWAVRHPISLPLFLWLMLLQEERSLHYSKVYLRHQGTIDPLFVETHRRHLADEARHVRWDEELLDELWERASPLVRGLNARLFAWMLEEFFGAPKRAQLRVLDELVREMPDLLGRLPEMSRQLLALSHDETFRKTLYSREIVPRTFARFDECPELRGLSLCGYSPRRST